MNLICLLGQPSMKALDGTINLTMMLICNHMSIIQALQHPSYQLPYQQPMLVSRGHLPCLLGCDFQASPHTTVLDQYPNWMTFPPKTSTYLSQPVPCMHFMIIIQVQSHHLPLLWQIMGKTRQMMDLKWKIHHCLKNICKYYQNYDT